MKRDARNGRNPGNDGTVAQELAPPTNLIAHRFDVGPDSFAVLEFPLADFALFPDAGSLTESERSVMRMILEGMTNAEIARARRRAVRTVANQVASLFKKLGIGSRCELYALAARSGPR